MAHRQPDPTLSKERQELVKRLDDLMARPRPGALARELRERSGMSVEEVAGLVGVETKPIADFERDGWSIEAIAIDAIFADELDDESVERIVDDYVRALGASEDESRLLRRDLAVEIKETIGDFVPPEMWEEVENRPARVQDPWESRGPTKPSKSRPRAKGPSLSPLSSIGTSARPQARSKPAADVPVVEFKIQVLTTVDGQERETTELCVLSKSCDTLSAVGLSLDQGKQLLKDAQRHIVERQAEAYVQAHAHCERCGRRYGLKGHHTLTYRTLFGNSKLSSPRFRSCTCARLARRSSWSPLAQLLTSRTAPELLMAEATWSSLVSYGLSTKVLKNLLPVDETLSASTVRCHTLETAQRLEAELNLQPVETGEPPPEHDTGVDREAAFTVGIDGGYLRHWRNRKTNFEVLVGKSVPDEGKAKCFGAVGKQDADPRARVLQMLRSQGFREGQRVRFLSDGEYSVREAQLQMGPDSEHVLDWFHITKRFTVLKQFIKGVVRIEKDEGEYTQGSGAHELQTKTDSAKWKLWHGKVADAAERIDDMRDLAAGFAEDYERSEKLDAAIEELSGYVRRNGDMICNYGKDHREGRLISTAFIESMVNSMLAKRFAKKQQMQWTPRGAHLLLQVRTTLANRDLTKAFRRWYPDLPPTAADQVLAVVNTDAESESASRTQVAA